MLTAPTVLTFVRTLVCVALAAFAADARSLSLLVGALLAYWIGDIADGALARATDRETRIGAVLDILADRLCSASVYLGFAWLDPSMVLPVTVFLFEFMVVDAFLSLAFLAWPVSSPNYFYLVDRPLWLLNWSTPGKAMNSSAVALLMLVTRSVVLSTLVAGVLLLLKLGSLVRLARLGMPVPEGCSAAASVSRDEVGAERL